MVYHLDTNFLIGLNRAESPQRTRVRAWLERGDRVGASSIAWCEYLCGPVPAAEVAAARRLIGAPEAFLEEDAELAARLFNAGGRRRGTLPDCQIAALALRMGATLATGNLADFQRFAALGLVLAG